MICVKCRQGAPDFNRYRCNACYAEELRLEEAAAVEERNALESTIQYHERPEKPMPLSRWRLKNASAKIQRLIGESIRLQKHMETP